MTHSDTDSPRAGNAKKLLEAAMICLRDKGYAKTTARDLVDVSGANLASIGYHFGSKDALLNEAIAEGMRTWTQEVERQAFAAAAGDANPGDRLRRALEITIDRFDELRPFLRAFVEAFPPAVRSDELRASLAAAYANERGAAAEMIGKAASEGKQALTEPQAKVLASLVLAAIDGLILQWLLDPSETPTSSEIVGALGAAAEQMSADAQPVSAS